MVDDTVKNGPWMVHTKTSHYENPWIRVEHSKVTHPNGEPGIYGVVRFKNRAIGVLPIDETGHVWLVGQHRFAFDEYSWELPEGGVPFNEDPLAGAKRELQEETGLTAKGWAEIGRFDLSNSVSDEQAIGYVAYNLMSGDNNPDPSEPSRHYDRYHHRQPDNINHIKDSGNGKTPNQG